MYISTQSMIRNTLNYIAKNNEEKDLHQRRIVTGQRIFSPLDDPAGDSISRRMRYDLMAIDQATRNTQNNHSMLKVAHGAMESTKSLLTSIKEKAIYAANDSISDKDRQIVQKEVNEFIAQIDYNTGTTYNGKFLIDGSHRRPTDGTIQALTNQQLSELTTTVTMLIELQDRQGEYLEINDTDRIDISYVKDAKTYSTSYIVGNTTLQDVIDRTNSLNGEVFNQTYTTAFIGVDAGGAKIFTGDNKNAITLRSVGVGVEHSVGGFTLSI